MTDNSLIGARNPILAPITPEPKTRREREAWAALAPSSQRRYRSALRKLSAFTEQRRLTATAASSGAEELADYLEAEAAAGRRGSLHIVLAALTFWQRASNVPATAKDPLVRLTLKRLQRQAPSPRQAAAIGDHELELIRRAAKVGRRGRFGRKETDIERKLRAYTDIALCQVMSDAGLRRSEAARLTWPDFSVWEDGSGRLRIAPSKGETEEKVVYLTSRAVSSLNLMKLLQRWWDPSTDKRIFRMESAQIARRIKRACAAASLFGNFSGHSGRVGMAQRMTRAGAPLTAVMRQGRWKSANMPARYTRNEDAGEAGKWLK